MWTIPREWEGERIYIIGGGRSIKHAGYSAIRDLHKTGRVIGVNDAYRLRYCDVIFFADRQWLQWPHTRRDLKPELYGRLVGRVARQGGDPPFYRLARDMMAGLSRSPQALAGWDGGANAINLAYLFAGGRPRDIVLLGFDMAGGNWHSRHLTPAPEAEYLARNVIPHFERMAEELRAEGISVINCSPGSALQCFPIKPLEAVL